MNTVNLDPTTTKYMVKATISADGIVEKPDVVGAIFGQTEGLLGNELDLRDLQKSGRIGRIEVEIDSKKGKSTGTITLPSSLDKVETAILAAALESIDRVGPCKADIKVTTIDDVRISKRKQVADRAKALLHLIMDETKDDSSDLTEEVRAAVRVEEAVTYGAERLTAGPNVSKADAIILVEGRSDVLNLLKCGIKNAIAVEGTNIPKTIRDLARDKVVTAFVDGDRGGELIMKELLQTCEVDFVARAPRNREVEELSQKAITKCLRNKIPAEQYVEMYNLDIKLEKGGMSPEKAKRLQRELDQRRTTIESRWEEEDEDDEKAPLPWDAAQRAAEHLPERGGGREPRQERGGGREPRESREPREAREPREGREPRGPREPREMREHREEPRREARHEPESTPTRGGAGGPGDYLSMLEELSGKLQAILLSEGNRVGTPIPVRDLADHLKKEGEKVSTVVFDGVVTQRLLDIAAEKGIKTLVGVKTGNITKRPESVEVLTRQDLERS